MQIINAHTITYNIRRLSPMPVWEIEENIVEQRKVYCRGIYRLYKKKGNRTLQCSSAFIIQSTEIILSQAERPGF